MEFLTRPFDIYCERLDAGLLAEPVNLATNACFVVSALLLYRRARCTTYPSVLYMLIITLAMIGVGSGLFHSIATGWTLIADVAFIFLFLCTYVYAFVRHTLLRPWWQAVLAVMIFIPINSLGKLLPEAIQFNGTAGYFGAYATLIVITGVCASRHLAVRPLVAAIAVFFCSMLARAADMAVCESFALGTHFLWHVLNAVTLYLVTLAMMMHLDANRGKA